MIYPTLPRNDSVIPTVVWLARITSSSELVADNYRWLYTVQPLRMSGDFNVANGTFSNQGGAIKAVNVREFENSATSVQGQNPSNLPSGFDYSACAGVVSCLVGASVFTSTAVDAELEQVWYFSLDNPVTGTCS